MTANGSRTFGSATESKWVMPIAVLFAAFGLFLVAGPADAHQVIVSPAGTPSTTVYPAAGEPEPIGVGAAPKSVAIAPNGEYAYVANVNGHTVSKIRISDNAVVETIPVGQYPRDVSVRWDNAAVAVASATQGVTEIQVANSPASVQHYATNWPMKAVEYRSSQFRLLVKDSDALWAMWPSSGTPVWVARDNFGGESGLCNLATVWANSDFHHVVSAEYTNEVLWINSEYNFVTRTPVGTRPCGIAASPNGQFAYVANQGSNNVSRINLTTKLVTHTIAVGTNPSAVAFSPDGAFAYVTNFGSNSVSRINTVTNIVDATIPVGSSPSDIAVAPGGAFAYVTNWGDNTVTRLNLTPGAPSISSATPGDKQASIVFTSPAANGSAEITNYEYSIDNGATWTTRSPASTASPLTITGLANGTTYQVRLRAVNAAGPGAASAAVAVTPRTVPGAPTGVVATAGDKSASVVFTPPASNGGAAISNYKYSIDNGATWVARSPASAVSPLVIPNLTNGTSYLVKLRAVNSAGDGAPSVAVSVTPKAPGPPGMVFVPVSPSRVVDTRASAGGEGPVVPGEAGMRVFSVAATQTGGLPVVPQGATAVVYNVTVPSTGGGGHVRVMPGDAAVLTSASAINFRPGETIANGLTAKIDADRRVKVYTSAPADVIIDVVGYFIPSKAGSPADAAGRFTPITPVRVYDAGLDAAGLLGAKADRVVSVGSTQDGTTVVVPAGASAVAYNITVVRPEGPGHLRVMPGDVLASQASTINWSASGDVIANGLTVKVDAQQRIRVFNSAGVPVRFLVDVVGYYSGAGALFYPTDPARVLDTRSGQGGAGPIGNGVANQRVVGVATALANGDVQVPEGATAIAYNLTVTGTTSGGHLRVYPAGTPLVDASTINWPGAGFNRANGTVVGVSSNREVTIYNGSTPADALIDTLGYYAP